MYLKIYVVIEEEYKSPLAHHYPSHSPTVPEVLFYVIFLYIYE